MSVINNRKLTIVGLILLVLLLASIFGGFYVTEKLTDHSNERLKMQNESLRIEIESPTLIGDFESGFVIKKLTENIPSF